MKLAIALLLTCAVLASHQHSSIEKRQAVYWMPNVPSSGQFYYASHPRYFGYPYVGQDFAARGVFADSPKSNSNEDDSQISPRLNFGAGYIQTSNGLVVPAGGNVYYMNRLLRPVYVTSTVSVSNAIVSTCIPRSLFVSNSENNICAGVRRRREIVELLDQLDDGVDISPSNVEKVVATPQPKMIDFNEQPMLSASLEQVSSSKIEEAAIDGAREKRFFNLFSAPTITVTAYSITNTTLTKTLVIATGSGVLNCRPSSIVVC